MARKDGEELSSARRSEITQSELDRNIARAQKIVRQHIPEGLSLVDDLIAERREEARKELDA